MEISIYRRWDHAHGRDDVPVSESGWIWSGWCEGGDHPDAVCMCCLWSLCAGHADADDAWWWWQVEREYLLAGCGDECGGTVAPCAGGRGGGGGVGLYNAVKGRRSELKVEEPCP